MPSRSCAANATAAFSENPSRATVKGFGPVEADLGAANFNVSAFRPACGPTAIRYWIEAAPRLSSASRKRGVSPSLAPTPSSATLCRCRLTENHPNYLAVDVDGSLPASPAPRPAA